MKNFLLLSSIIAITGCATGYQAQSFSGGYSETQLDLNVFKVTFKGNGYTKSDRAEDFALLRSAELTLKYGFSHFAIIDGRQSADYGVITSPSQSYTTGTATVIGNTAYVSARTSSEGESYIIRRPSASNTIVCFNGKPDNGMPVYNAQYVFNSLSTKYGINTVRQSELPN